MASGTIYGATDPAAAAKALREAFEAAQLHWPRPVGHLPFEKFRLTAGAFLGSAQWPTAALSY